MIPMQEPGTEQLFAWNRRIKDVTILHRRKFQTCSQVRCTVATLRIPCRDALALKAKMEAKAAAKVAGDGGGTKPANGKK
jgi:hypothetical protein